MPEQNDKTINDYEATLRYYLSLPNSTLSKVLPHQPLTLAQAKLREVYNEINPMHYKKIESSIKEGMCYGYTVLWLSSMRAIHKRKLLNNINASFEEEYFFKAVQILNKYHQAPKSIPDDTKKNLEKAFDILADTQKAQAPGDFFTTSGGSEFFFFLFPFSPMNYFYEESPPVLFFESLLLMESGTCIVMKIVAKNQNGHAIGLYVGDDTLYLLDPNMKKIENFKKDNSTLTAFNATLQKLKKHYSTEEQILYTRCEILSEKVNTSTTLCLERFFKLTIDDTVSTLLRCMPKDDIDSKFNLDVITNNIFLNKSTKEKQLKIIYQKLATYAFETNGSFLNKISGQLKIEIFNTILDLKKLKVALEKQSITIDASYDLRNLIEISSFDEKFKKEATILIQETIDKLSKTKPTAPSSEINRFQSDSDYGRYQFYKDDYIKSELSKADTQEYIKYLESLLDIYKYSIKESIFASKTTLLMHEPNESIELLLRMSGRTLIDKEQEFRDKKHGIFFDWFGDRGDDEEASKMAWSCTFSSSKSQKIRAEIESELSNSQSKEYIEHLKGLLDIYDNEITKKLETLEKSQITENVQTLDSVGGYIDIVRHRAYIERNPTELETIKNFVIKEESSDEEIIWRTYGKPYGDGSMNLGYLMDIFCKNIILFAENKDHHRKEKVIFHINQLALLLKETKRYHSTPSGLYSYNQCLQDVINTLENSYKGESHKLIAETINSLKTERLKNHPPSPKPSP